VTGSAVYETSKMEYGLHGLSSIEENFNLSDVTVLDVPRSDGSTCKSLESFVFSSKSSSSRRIVYRRDRDHHSDLFGLIRLEQPSPSVVSVILNDSPVA